MRIRHLKTTTHDLPPGRRAHLTQGKEVNEDNEIAAALIAAGLAERVKSEDETPLPDGFPARSELAAAKLGTVEALRVHMAANSLEDINGIGPKSAAAIEEALTGAEEGSNG